MNNKPVKVLVVRQVGSTPSLSLAEVKARLDGSVEHDQRNHPRKVIQWLGKAFNGIVQTAHTSTNKKENKNNGKS